MKKFMILLFIIALFLSGCGKQQEMGLVNMIYVIELTSNSDFPMQLMRRVELSKIDREYVSVENPYCDPNSVNKEIRGLGFPYPYHDSNNWYITQIYIYVNKYNILGLTVGDDRRKIDTTMEKYGYCLVVDRESYIRYKKGEISISFSFEPNPYVVVSVHRVTLDDILSYY